MEEREPRDEDDAPTEPEDWIGAAEVRPNIEAGSGSRSNMDFHVFRSSKDHSLFAVLDCDDSAALPICPKGGSWEFFKKFAETGQPRIGFSEKDARRDIESQGYHLSQVNIDATVGVA